MHKIICGDCLIELKNLSDNSIDACITDPPYELGFMGKEWDKTGIAYRKDLWQEVLRVLKPGGHLLSFGGSRTYHRMACAIEDAGFEIRDQIMWVYGSGFPKSLNIGKATDKLRGNKRKIVGNKTCVDFKKVKDGDKSFYENAWSDPEYIEINVTKGNSEWEGWGTGLKPAHEPIVLARKPLSEKSVVENLSKWGVGGLSIDNCRVAVESKTTTEQGRHPANFVHDGSQEVVDLFPGNKGALAPVRSGQKGFGGVIYGKYATAGDDGKTFYGDGLGSASRFFYCAKASKSERNAGLTGFKEKVGKIVHNRKCKICRHQEVSGRPCKCENPDWEVIDTVRTAQNFHPTVKPLALMRYLCRLITPDSGTVLDPFTGSGSTGIAAKKEGFNFIGVELNQEYVNIAKKRIENVGNRIV